jgi:hypothetical protein
MSKYGNTVALAMDKIANSPEHLKLFYKKASQCCKTGCDCSKENCPCFTKGCTESCPCGSLKQTSAEEVISKLISISEILDNRKLQKSAALALDAIEMISKEAGVLSNILETPPRGVDYTDLSQKDIPALSETLDSLESDPSYAQFDEILSDPDTMKILDKLKKKMN